MIQDLLTITQWWTVFFLFGIISLPLCFSLFDKFFDLGYPFSKIIGILIISYAIYALATARLLPFTAFSLYFLLVIFSAVNFLVLKSNKNIIKLVKNNIIIFLFEEILFLAAFIFWAFVRAHEPSVHGLEKYMDFGFVNSILRSTYFPPKDMWFPPFPINYYYFGHIVTAVLTKISFIPSFLTFNLMVATIFALLVTFSFSIGANLLKGVSAKKIVVYIGGILTSLLVSFSGNLQIIYSFFTPYKAENPVPFWQLTFSPSSFPNSYWYPNATRFIPFTIHEFPIYSFVVSDLHGHVLDIPMVLLSIALIYNLFLGKEIKRISLIFLSFVLAVMYMTNTWDAIIYFGLFVACLLMLRFHKKVKKISSALKDVIKKFIVVAVGIAIFSVPFSIFFKPFVSGIGIICAPTFLTKLQKLGPFLFEANHCQRSEWWQLFTLYGFFYIFATIFIIFISRIKLKKLPQDLFTLILIVISTILIIVPEFIYAKDIYPAHYRANTMFKLVYQSFIMLSIVSSYTIVRVLNKTKRIIFIFIFLPLISLVIIYSYFAIKSYYSDLKTYVGLNGLVYLKNLHPDDYDAISWINKNIKNQPVILEAQGDSYTDYARISANTGLPTVLGWTVHEWLWRGSYGIPAPRIQEIKDIYETTDKNLAASLLKKYNVSYVYIGDLEKEKYPDISVDKFINLGNVVYKKGNTEIYKIY